MFQKPTNGSTADYPQQFGRLIDIAADGPPLRNFIRNGDFQIAQRGASIAGITGVQYTLDGWATLSTAGTTTISQQAFAIGQTAVPGNPKNFMRIQRTVAAGAANAAIASRIENPERLSGKTVTIGFSSQCTSGAKSFSIQLRTGGGLVWTADPADQAFTAPLAWGQTKLTFVLPAMSAAPAGSSMDVYVSELSGFSTFTLELADSQLEIGNEATGFERLTYLDQWRWAQRFLPGFSVEDANTYVMGNGMCIAAGSANIVLPFPVLTRVRPTGIVVSAAAHFGCITAAGGTTAATGMTWNGSRQSSGCINLTGMAGLVAGNATQMYSNNSSANLIFTGAEI